MSSLEQRSASRGRGPSARLVVLHAALVAVAAGAAVWLGAEFLDGRDGTRGIAAAGALTETMAVAAADPLERRDSAALRELVDGASGSPGASVAIVDRSGTVVAHTDPARIGLTLSTEERLSLRSRVRLDERSGTADRLFGAAGYRYSRPLERNGETLGMVATLTPIDEASLPLMTLLAVVAAVALLSTVFFVLSQRTADSEGTVEPELFQRLWKSSRGDFDPLATPPAHPTTSEAIRMVEAIHDRNEALLVENRLHKYDSDRLKLVMDHLPDGALATDAEGKIVYLNRAAASMLGLDRNAVVGHPLNQVSSEIEPLAEEARRAGRAILTRMLPDGHRSLSLRRAAMTDARGNATGSVFAFRDVTQQESANRAQSEFISQISHELKAPLNTIVAYIDALADPELLSDDERREYFNNLNSEAQRMARLISNLLQISRIELGSLTARFNFLKPMQLLRDITGSVAAQMDANDHIFNSRVPESLPALFGDRDLLSVAVSNLLSNAIKYTPRGGRVDLNAREHGGGVLVEVKDSGIGIPPEMVERVFERFVRSEQEDVVSRPGSGLGLALVKEIVELHDGRVEVESELGKGSTFRIWLPTREVNDQINLAAA